MWKDFFYFSKSERRAILFLLTLLFIFMCIWVLFPVKEESLEQDQEGIEEIKNFLAGVHEMEEKESLRYSYDKPKRREVVLAAFDPNSADSIEFLQRGLSPFIAHTILQYRRAGGIIGILQRFLLLHFMYSGQKVFYFFYSPLDPVPKTLPLLETEPIYT